MGRKVAVVTGFLALFAAPIAWAQPAADADCSTPRRAAQAWLGNLQDDNMYPDVAIACFDWRGAGVTGAARVAKARALKSVLDGRGIWVEMDDIDDTVEADGAPRVHLVAQELLPEIWFVRQGRRWLMSSNSIGAIDRLYADTFTFDVDAVVAWLPDWMGAAPMLGVRWWQLFLGFIALFLSLLLRSVVAWVVGTYGVRLMSRRGGQADRAVVAKAAKPIGTIALAFVLWNVLPLLRFGVRANQILTLGVRLVAALAAVMLLYRVVDVLAAIFARRAAKTETKLDDQLVPLVRRTLKVFVVAIGAIFVLQNMNVDVTSLLAMGTVGTLAVSFAAKDTVGNLFGSISIFADRPFQLGDWVVIGATEGVVEEVGMRSTRVRTFYNSVVTVPNSIITVTPVDNYGQRKFRRTSATLSLTYDTTPEQMEAFCDGVRALLRANERVRKDYYEVHFKGFGPSSLDVMLYFFFETDSWSVELRERHRVYLEILRLADTLGVAFAFPTQTLHVDSVATPGASSVANAPSDEALAKAVAAFAPGGSLSRPEGPKISDGHFPSSK